MTRNILGTAVIAGGVTDIKVPGYRVGGKTGTAEAVADDGIGLDGYTASLVFMAPMGDPSTRLWSTSGDTKATSTGSLRRSSTTS